MENASKALLIAGAILLVIALIAIGMMILGQGSDTVNNAKGQMGSMGISTHNSMFKEFAQGSTVNGRQVKDLVTKIANYNQEVENPDWRVAITLPLHGKVGTHPASTAHDVALTGVITNAGTLQDIYDGFSFDVIAVTSDDNGVIVKIVFAAA